MGSFRLVGKQETSCTSLKSLTTGLKDFLWFMDLTWAFGSKKAGWKAQA